jgi:hypothetical protein
VIEAGSILGEIFGAHFGPALLTGESITTLPHALRRGHDLLTGQSMKVEGMDELVNLTREQSRRGGVSGPANAQVGAHRE